MAIVYATQTELIGFAELEQRRLGGELGERGDSGDLCLIPQTRTDSTIMRAGAAAPVMEGADFHSIGIGKPLSVRIYTIYAGDLPPKNRPGRTRDVMVVSGVNAAQTFDATPRAINLIQDQVRDKAMLQFGAFQDGSPIVYYTPSLTDDETACSFELVPDTFPNGVVDRIASLFQRAGGLPVFTPASSYLLAGSTLVKMFGAFGAKFLERSPTLVDTLTLRFQVGGFPSFAAGVYALFNDGDRAEFAGFRPELVDPGEMALVNAGRPYDGPAPYILVGIDGREEPQLVDFVGHVASAALLEKFYPTAEDGAAVLIDQLEVAVTLLNDFNYSQRAQKMQKRLAGMGENDPGRAELTKLLAAYQGNIQTEEFKVG
jgi:hypothetical protein